MKIVIFLLFGGLGAAIGSGGHWNYENFDDWPGVCNTGDKQSPIDIPADAEDDHMLNSLTLHKYNKNFNNAKFTLTNNGHSVVATFNPSEIGISLKNGELDAEYHLIQFHWHWSDVSSEGSEHKISGVARSMELHLVHSDLQTPAKLAVLGVLIQEAASGNDQPYKDLLENDIAALENKDGSAIVELESFKFSDILPGNGKVFRYSGSLTTPGCDEIVTWTVLENIYYVTSATMDMFRTVKNSDGEDMAGNFRPTQDLNDRDVFKSTGQYSVTSA